MESISVASRIKSTPRFLAIRTRAQMKTRLHSMKSIEIWMSMNQKGLAAWKHKMMSDELHQRKVSLLTHLELNSFLFE